MAPAKQLPPLSFRPPLLFGLMCRLQGCFWLVILLDQLSLVDLPIFQAESDLSKMQILAPEVASQTI